jgi:UDP-glucose 4-epimerase
LKIFITGGAGFIASHLIDYHLSKGDTIFAIDDLSTGSLDNIALFKENPNFHFEEADILTWPRLESMIDTVDRVYHLAAVVGIYRVLEAPINLINTNIAASERLIKAVSFSRKNPVLLIASSSEVYGHSEKNLLKESDTLIIESALEARWNYAISKLADEVIGVAYSKQNKLPILIIRFFNTIGPRQTGRYGMVVPRFVQQACQNKPLTIFGDGNQTRSFCDVRDTIIGLDLLMQNKESYGKIINVGNDKEISIKNLAELIKQRAKSQSEFQYLSYEKAYGEKFTDIAHRRPDLSLFFQLTGFQHQWTLEKTIDDLIHRYRQQAHGDDV